MMKTGQPAWRVLSVAVAAAITAGLLYLLSRRVDLGAAIAHWRHIRPGPVAAALAVIFVEAFLVESYKWRLLMRWKGMPLPYREALRIKMSAAIFHAGLPLKLGAVTEGFYLHRVHGFKLDHALSSIAADLLLNFMALLFLATASTALVSIGGQSLLGLPYWVWTLLGLAGIAVLLLPFLPPGIAALEAAARLFPGRPGAFVGGLLEGFRGLSAARKCILVGLAVGMQSMGFLLFYFCLLAFGIEVPAGYLFLVTPIVLFVGAIPVTVSGFGAREWLVVLFFTRHRELMTAEQAVGASIFAGVSIMLFYMALSMLLLPSYLRGIAAGRGLAGK